ncbi:MAG: hypothetical protein KKB20_21445 [Proteobacteria bacterium]|nr:hypothetical protein [Pseudomonadota bacterium]
MAKDMKKLIPMEITGLRIKLEYLGLIRTNDRSRYRVFQRRTPLLAREADPLVKGISINS